MVTNVGVAHAGNFPDGIEGVARAKFELIENTKPGGVVILNGDDERVRQFGLKYSGTVLFYGISPGADVWAERISDLGALGTEFEVGCSRAIECSGVSTVHAKLPLIGRHNLLNALAAVAAGMASEIPLETCAAAIGTLSAGDKRGEVLHVVLPRGRGSATLINDCYNSNPKALKAMIDALAKVPAERRIAIAGEMLELGEQAAELHRECGRFIAAERIDLTIGVRGKAEELVAGVREGEAPAEFVATPKEAGEWMKQNLRDGDAVLLKASRGVRLETALDVLANDSEFEISHG
jgi:UDP-N-acetylmuramoyl-tripeptide--D-alanyl-D-alanine ligase